MLNYLSLTALPFAALARHAITQWFRTARLKHALARSRPADRAAIIQACAVFDLGSRSAGGRDSA